MKKKICPPGQICIKSNILIIILIFIILILIYLILSPINKNNNFIQKKPKAKEYKIKNNENNNIKNNCVEKSLKKKINRQSTIHNIDNNLMDEQTRNTNIVIKYQPQSTGSYLVNKDHERIINPLLPPERRNSYIDPESHLMVSAGVPINIPTRGHTGGFQQIGTLHKIESADSTLSIGQNNEPVILPLMGAPTYQGSHKWSYYTSTDKYNQIKLPLTNKNRKCDSEYGCDELYDDDIVTIPAYNGSFKVKKYEFDKPRYLPFV